MTINNAPKADLPLSAGKPVFFFYLDGTLIETDHANNAAYVRSVEKVLGENISKMLDVNGPRITRTVVAQRLADYASGDEIRRIVRLKEEEYDNVICLTTPIEHVADILRSVKDDYVTVLVSNCREQRGLALLDYHNIRDCFTHLFFRQTDDTARNADNAGNLAKPSVSEKTNMPTRSAASASTADGSLPSKTNFARLWTHRRWAL